LPELAHLGIVVNVKENWSALKKLCLPRPNKPQTGLPCRNNLTFSVRKRSVILLSPDGDTWDSFAPLLGICLPSFRIIWTRRPPKSSCVCQKILSLTRPMVDCAKGPCRSLVIPVARVLS